MYSGCQTTGRMDIAQPCAPVERPHRTCMRVSACGWTTRVSLASPRKLFYACIRKQILQVSRKTRAVCAGMCSRGRKINPHNGIIYFTGADHEIDLGRARSNTIDMPISQLCMRYYREQTINMAPPYLQMLLQVYAPSAHVLIVISSLTCTLSKLY